MELPELHDRLTRFARARTGDPWAAVSDIEVMPGHAGFSWGFVLHTGNPQPPLPRGEGVGGGHELALDSGASASTTTNESDALGTPTPRTITPSILAGEGSGEWGLVLRLPPPGVRWVGTADVVRQARIMQALAGTAVPVPRVWWTGDDLEPFERPYYVVERLPGDTLRFRTPDGTPIPYETEALGSAARQVAAALAAIHAVPLDALPAGLGEALPLNEEVQRWEWLHARTADPALTALAPKVRDRLLATVPPARRTSLLHGDYQWTNHLFSRGVLQAVLDWELAGVGESLMDLGWLAVFSDLDAWVGLARWEAPLPDADAVIALYEEASGRRAEQIAWFRALAAYKFGLITGLNLSLHRRGKRIDPHWEDLTPSAPRLFERALELLG